MVNLFLWVVIVLSLVSCAGGSKVKKEDKALGIEEHFQLAFTAAERGNLEEAVNEYQKVLKLDPKHLKGPSQPRDPLWKAGKAERGDFGIQKGGFHRSQICGGLFQPGSCL